MEGDTPEVLLPCAICTRTFMPRSLEKHAKICERAAAKKRKPFDSAKQRIQGTDLAEFLPQQEKKRYSNDEKRKSSWKETHDDFLRTIRAARSETASIIINQRQSSSHASSGAPMRANEKGTCPTCNRQFGVKAYDRHVAWCKERSTRLPISPATKNIAKERLEARMKYRAPTLKNRRKSNRDKYSQSCTAIKTPNRVRETASVPDNTREKIKENITDSQKPIIIGRGDQSNNKETYNLGESREATKRSIASGSCKEYNPFLIAERQMQDLLSDSSDLSLTEIPSSSSTKSLLPLSHSSAFIKYPYQTKTNHLEKLITNEFDELTSDFSSDSTETNSLSREIFLKDFHDSKKDDQAKKISNRELGRRMIIDKSLVLGNEINQDKSNNITKQYKNDISGHIFNKGISKSVSNRPQTIRAFSAPKSIYQRKSKTSNDNNNQGAKFDNNVKNDYLTFSSSDLSLSSIVSSEIDLKRSNSVFDQLITSFEDDIVGNDSFPSLRSLLRNESLRTSSNGPPVPDNKRRFDGHISDEEFSSADTFKQQEHKINADSAYSSLNRKYSNHGRSSNNDTTNRMEDNISRNNRRESQSSISKTKCRMSRFCHECGSRFPETAKFCCQCGVKRLAL
ncbi:bromodomain-containing protein DDB_G0270170-like isoform X3 [Vespula pensylvanica]|uniref:bromodomain-containing protein DDB_G0270170-like isoform X3 n=1 Tax=Vespula pensylvanica TaxID=30213 RepID=UPI001CB9DB3A|nr:bromodomain-containing protein DDB_G0270170-like isoform X3 [Vespula pensylvanica]